MSIAKEVASAIVKSGYWPDANPNAVLMLCYLAEAEGNHPAVVYRDYHIMQGKPAKKAEAILRDFVNAGGKIEWHQLDDEAADATFAHSSGSARITWTIERAKKANLKSPMWSKYPRQMLRSRCVSEGVRTVYPGATSGLYEEGEVADIVAESGPVEGHSEDRTVSPQQERPSYDFPDGPATGITALKAEVRSIWSQVAGCTDPDQLLAYIETQEVKAIMEQCEGLENPQHREIWEGDGKDNPGLSNFIKNKTAQLEKERDMNALSGGQFQKENA